MTKQFCCITVSVTLFLAQHVASGANVWSGGAGNKDWFDGGNWSAGVPGTGDDVSIGGGANVLVTNATAALGDFAMSGGTLTFSNWYARIEATNIAISGGTVTLPPPFKDNEMSNRVWFVSSGDFTLGASAGIDANGKGYSAPRAYANGHGPGRGYSCAYGSGAGYGGRGGFQGTSATKAGGVTYGAAETPLHPGSSGGQAWDVTWIAGDGGGAVRIDTEGKATVNGAILANAVYNGTYAGGGSGGGVFITCRTFAGSGRISANGSKTALGGGGGGGGRIAAIYNPAAQSNETAFAVTFTASGGTGTGGYPPKLDGGAGTLYFPDAALLGETIALPHAGRLVIPNFNSWNLASLNITTNCDLALPDGVTVTVTGNCNVSGVLDLGWGGNMGIGGALKLHGSGALKLRSAATNGVVNYGAMLAVANDITITNTSWIYLYSNPTNGGAPLVICRNLTVPLANAGINADFGGFKGGDSGISSDGAGPGKGWGGYYGGGAAHGGQGGWANAQNGWSLAYGNGTTNLLPGSGGGSYAEGNGGDGGGLVRVWASGDIILNGLISANGAGGFFYSGGGAGGGVELACRTLGGTGVIRANAGAAGAGGGFRGGGGGGRIAIHYDPVAQSNAAMDVTFTAAGGASPNPPNGERGSIYFPPLLQENVSRPHIGKFIVPNLALWQPGFITVNTNCDIELPQSLAIDIAGNLTIKSGSYGFSGNTFVGGNVILTNGGRMALYSGPTNGIAPDYSLLLNVAGDLVIYSNSWIYAYSNKTNGGAPRVLVNNLRVPQANSGIDASACGFLGGSKRGYGNNGSDGMGPGKGLHPYYGGGGGHGGAGGNASANSGGGPANGATNAPGVGSGGGEGASFASGGSGGGRIRIEAAGTMLINGTMKADGEASGDYGGGGAGGGIWLIGKKILGTGTFNAKGGPGHSGGGAGGGGRIAFWSGGPYPPEIYAPLSRDLPAKRARYVSGFEGFTPTLSVTNGVTGYAPGSPGTVVFINLPPYGGTLLLLQ